MFYRIVQGQDHPSLHLAPPHPTQLELPLLNLPLSPCLPLPPLPQEGCGYFLLTTQIVFSMPSPICLPTFPSILESPAPAHFYLLRKLLCCYLLWNISSRRHGKVNKAYKAQKYMKLTRLRELLIRRALPQGYTSSNIQGYTRSGNCWERRLPLQKCLGCVLGTSRTYLFLSCPHAGWVLQ